MSTYVPIQAITVTGSNLLGTTGVTFTNIPQNYTDLFIVQNVSLTNPAIGLIRVGNNTIDTGSNYSQTSLSGNGSAANSQRLSNATVWQTILAHMTAGWGTYRTNIMNYSNTTTNKTCLQRYDNVPYGALDTVVGLWRNTAAINTIQLFLDRAESYLVGSTFTLYGIGSGSPKAFGGDEVRTDGTYWYHIYNSSGRFEPVENLSNVDFLVIAGGGGGGRADVNNNGGGGGAGGYRTSAGTSGGGAAAQSKLSLSANTSYTVTVGAGGAGGANDYTGGSNGGSSSFSTVSTTGGGGGGAVNSPGGGGKGRDGGSGGGSGDFNTNWTGGLGTANEGFDGGSGIGAAGTSRNMGGGGGAGGAGASYVTQTGGAGVASTITGTSVTRAVGGNGSNAGGSASANTGSGGNGNRSSAAGNGGSGFIVVRYSV